MVIVCGCGVIVSHARCKHGEKIISLLEMLEALYPKPVKMPDYLLYDRACFVREYLDNKKNLDALGDLVRWGNIALVVDRFHFAGHKHQRDTCK